MRIVKHTSHFHRDYKREKSGQHAKRLDAALLEAVTLRTCGQSAGCAPDAVVPGGCPGARRQAMQWHA